MTERGPDWAAIAEQEIESRREQQFNCSDPPEESCPDAACPVHADGDDPDWGDEVPYAYGWDEIPRDR